MLHKFIKSILASICCIIFEYTRQVISVIILLYYIHISIAINFTLCDVACKRN